MIIISACLSGSCQNYKGDSKCVPALRSLVLSGKAVPVCPELCAGLQIPRGPFEITGTAEGCFSENPGSSVKDIRGKEFTGSFKSGALIALKRAVAAGATAAILKERSPSCGVSQVYDGTFSGTVIRGEGLFAHLLRKKNITLFSEENVPYDSLSSL